MGGFISMTVVGNLGGDVQMKDAGGKQVAEFSLAVNYKKGQEDRCQWVRCTAWEKKGEIAQRYLRKGAEVMVVGSVECRAYEKNGPQASLELTVRELVLLSNGGAAARNGEQARGGADDPFPPKGQADRSGMRGRPEEPPPPGDGDNW